MAAEKTSIPSRPLTSLRTVARPASALLLSTLLLGTGASFVQAQTAHPGESVPEADTAHAPITPAGSPAPANGTAPQDQPPADTAPPSPPAEPAPAPATAQRESQPAAQPGAPAAESPAPAAGQAETIPAAPAPASAGAQPSSDSRQPAATAGQPATPARSASGAPAPAPQPAQANGAPAQTPPASRPPPLPPTGTQPVPSGSASARLPAAPDTTDYKKQARNCVVPESLLSAPTRLPGLTASLVRGKGDLLVLVLGSESTNPNTPLKGGLAALRTSAQPRQTPFAARLEARLTHDLPPMPTRAIRVESIGRRNATVGEQAALIGKQVLPRRPALVIWNIGRADARRGMPPARMARALDKGLEQLRRQNIDTIVLDPPYHPQFEALYRTDDYRQYLRWTMNLHDQPMMRRHDMIDYWASTGRIDLDSGDAGRQETAVVFTETCIAYQLSRMIDKSLDRGMSPAARQQKPGG